MGLVSFIYFLRTWAFNLQIGLEKHFFFPVVIPLRIVPVLEHMHGLLIALAFAFMEGWPPIKRKEFDYRSK